MGVRLKLGWESTERNCSCQDAVYTSNHRPRMSDHYAVKMIDWLETCGQREWQYGTAFYLKNTTPPGDVTKTTASFLLLYYFTLSISAAYLSGLLMKLHTALLAGVIFGKTTSNLAHAFRRGHAPPYDAQQCCQERLF